MALDSAKQPALVGYDPETAAKYTAGHEQFFNVDKVEDGATLGMVKAIEEITAGQPLDTVYDIGTGSNRDYLRTWLKATGAKVVVGVEPSAGMRRLSEESKIDDEPITVIEGSWSNTSLPPGSADLVVSRFSLHHMRDIHDGYVELSRILKSGGYAVIALPHPDFCRQSLANENKEAVDGMPMSVRAFGSVLHYYYHDVDAYIGENATLNGLDVLEVQSFNWGTTENPELAKPNTLLFVLKKRSESHPAE